MTLQWTVIASFLYVETAVVVLFLLPTIRPWAWSKLFRSNAAQAVSKYMYLANIMVVFMALMFLDAMRDVYRYTRHAQDTQNPAGTAPMAELQIHMKMFRAQRNLHISGFAIMFWFVIHRLVQITVMQARLLADNQVLLKQAEGASRVAREALGGQSATTKDNKSALGNASSSAKASAPEDEEKENEIVRLRKALESRENEVFAIKKQSENLTKEYDRLMNEHEKLQKTTGTTATVTRVTKKVE